ncbi:MAG: hypothetical protein M1823_009084, partial [Watsoniomyces obsoletus]
MLVSGKEGNKLTLGAGKQRIEKWSPKDPGILEIARALIDKGADVNAQGGYYGNALQAASAGGHEAMERLLLDKSAI